MMIPAKHKTPVALWYWLVGLGNVAIVSTMEFLTSKEFGIEEWWVILPCVVYSVTMVNLAIHLPHLNGIHDERSGT